MKVHKQTYMHKQKHIACIYKLSKFFSPFCQLLNKGVKTNNKKDVYAIYIIKRRDVKLAPLHTCITWRRDD